MQGIVLSQALPDDIRQAGGSLLAEAIHRMREGRVTREAGYDGQFGIIRIFDAGELPGKRQG